jgi:hypothetical protein
MDRDVWCVHISNRITNILCQRDITLYDRLFYISLYTIMEILK